MALQSRGAGLRPSDDGLLLRIEEQFYGPGQFISATQGGRQLVSGGLVVGVSAANVLAVVFGDAAFSSFASVAGRWVGQLVSAAARVTRQSGQLRVPISQQFSAAPNAIPAALYGRPLRSYTLRVPVRVLVVGTAFHEIGLVTSNGMLTMLGTDPGAVWSSDPAVNAGRWLPRSRQVVAGAITNGPDSGLTATAWRQLGVRYTEGVPPRIEWLIDDVPLHVLSGDAAMPVTLASPVTDYNPG